LSFDICQFRFIRVRIFKKFERDFWESLISKVRKIRMNRNFLA
jgi:hypothetical protein